MSLFALRYFEGAGTLLLYVAHVVACSDAVVVVVVVCRSVIGRLLACVAAGGWKKAKQPPAQVEIERARFSPQEVRLTKRARTRWLFFVFLRDNFLVFRRNNDGTARSRTDSR